MSEKIDILEEKTQRMITCIAIDDDPLFLKNLQIMLQQFEGVVMKGAYSNPVKGVMAIVKEKPDVILLDLEMPYLDGLEALETLDKVPKIIVISAHQEPKANGMPIARFIHKNDLMKTPELLSEALKAL